jgi:hypothetical protein
VDYANGTVDFTRSFLHPYMRNAQLKACPSFVPEARYFAFGHLGYGYNYAYLSPFGPPPRYTPTPVSLAQIVNPAETVWLADSARLNNFWMPTKPKKRSAIALRRGEAAGC